MKFMRRIIAALFLFGISFGYVEAAVVVYLRAIYDPIRQHLHPGRKPHDLFPLISPQQLADAGPEYPRRLAIESAAKPRPWRCSAVSLWRVAARFTRASRPSRSRSACGTSRSTRF